MPVAAHPALLPGRVADHQSIVGYIFGHHTPRAYEGVSAHRDPTDDRRVGPDRCAPAKQGLFIEVLAVDLRAGVGHVGQYAAGPQEYIIFKFTSCIDRYVVLDLYPAPHPDTLAYIDVLPDYTFPADDDIF